jgi:hypothetical protein
MKKLILLLFVAILLAACQPAPAPLPTDVPLTEPPPSSQEVVNSWREALNEGDIDTALSYLAEDAVVTISPAGPEGDAVFTGHSEIRGWYETMTAAKGVTTLSDCNVDGESMSCLDTYTDEGLKSMGVDFIVGEWEATFKDGRIQSYTFTATPESLAKLAPPAEPTPEPTTELATANLLGIYKTLIGPEGAAYGIDTGSYLLKLRDDLRWFVVDPKDGFIYVQGYYTGTADQIVFKTTGGPVMGSCSHIENTYGWLREGDALTFTPISVDPKCEGEKFFFTSNPLTLQP